MSVRASVVVPVYNPGRYLDACIASLRRQSLPPDAFEAIFVDDGSTDGSGARLDRLANEWASARVAHLPNSGWPGRPRNVGLGMATGEYVLFLDHDDWLGDEALERMLATADRTDADVVVGREVGHGRGVPVELFRRNVDDATLERDPLVRLLTPHKLFRHAMLEEHAIRFPEGRRRFEDHVFVMRAFFAARRIAILADYPCYHWVTRAGRANASDEYADPRSYYANLRDVLDVVESNTEPGPLRDRLIAHWYRRRCLDRLRGERWADAPAAHDRDVFDAVRDLARERMGAGVVAALPLSHRLRSAAVTSDRPDLVTALARVEHGLRARIRVDRLEREGRWLRLTVTADLVDGSGAPMRFTRRDGRAHWLPPDPIGSRTFRADQLDATSDLDHAELSLVVRSEDRTVTHDAPATVERVLRETPGGTVLSLLAHADIDLSRLAAGISLPEGRWDLLAEVRVCGWRSLRSLPHVRVPEVAPAFRLDTAPDGGIGLVVGDPPPRSTRPERPVRRRRSGRHPVERLVPRALVRIAPVRVRQLAKRLLLRSRADS